MNKLSLTVFLLLCAPSTTQPAIETKQQKMEQLFELTNDKQQFATAYEPIFASVNITDEHIKQAAMDAFFVNLKQEYLTTYDKLFTESEIEDMIKYHSSVTGKKVMATSLQVAQEMQNAYTSIMSIIQDLIKEQKTDSNNADKSSTVINFDNMTKDKSAAEIKELFNKEIQHDGLTVVKFSALWCGPCKAYAPTFEQVAEQLTEVVVDGKKVTIKYITMDIDVVKIIAQDYSVKSIPTTIFFKNGQKVDSKVGSLKKDDLDARIKKLAN